MLPLSQNIIRKYATKLATERPEGNSSFPPARAPARPYIKRVAPCTPKLELTERTPIGHFHLAQPQFTRRPLWRPGDARRNPNPFIRWKFTSVQHDKTTPPSAGKCDESPGPLGPLTSQISIQRAPGAEITSRTRAFCWPAGPQMRPTGQVNDEKLALDRVEVRAAARPEQCHLAPARRAAAGSASRRGRPAELVYVVAGWCSWPKPLK